MVFLVLGGHDGPAEKMTFSAWPPTIGSNVGLERKRTSSFTFIFSLLFLFLVLCSKRAGARARERERATIAAPASVSVFPWKLHLDYTFDSISLAFLYVVWDSCFNRIY
jgi:hypothetical protein